MIFERIVASPLQFSYGNGLSLNTQRQVIIEGGTVTAVLGDNGSGKTTFVRLIVGLLRPNRGSVAFFADGALLSAVERKQVVGYMPQMGSALNRLTPREALFYTCRLRGYSARASRVEATSRLVEWGIEKPDRQCIYLSGGQQRLVKIAVAFAGRPSVVILDEPTNDLDPLNRVRVLEAIRQSNLRDGCTVLMVTHAVREVETYIDAAVIFRHGRVVAMGSPDSLRAASGADLILNYTSIDDTGLPQCHHRRLTSDEVHDAIRGLDLTRVSEVHLRKPNLEEVYVERVS